MRGYLNAGLTHSIISQRRAELVGLVGAKRGTRIWVEQSVPVLPPYLVAQLAPSGTYVEEFPVKQL
jgi:hypothetical protein